MREGDVLRSLADAKSLIPDASSRGRTARCLMIYGWGAPIGPAWLEMIETVMGRVGLLPEEATANSGPGKSQGSYKRVRKTLVRYLEANSRGQVPTSVTVGAGRIERGESFFPF